MSDNTIAFVFPGQGSQKVGMLAAAHEQFQAVRDTFAEASAALGYDMWDLIQNGEQEALNLTETTQPVLLSCSVALWRAWLEQAGATTRDYGGAQPGRVFRTGLCRRAGICRCRATGAPARRVYADRGAGGRGRDGGDYRSR